MTDYILDEVPGGANSSPDPDDRLYSEKQDGTGDSRAVYLAISTMMDMIETHDGDVLTHEGDVLVHGG